MSDLPAILRDFSGYKITVQNRSPKTVDQYCTDLTLLFRFLIAQRSGKPTAGEEFSAIDVSCVDIDFVKSITKEDLYLFLLYTARERLNESKARARKLSAIRSFYKYLCNFKGCMDENPAADIESPKLKKTLPKYLSLDESLDLLASVKNDTENPQRLRNYCILTLFLNCGMRLAELTAISIGDLDKDLRSVRVTGKGNKERIIYLNSACKAALVEYLEYRSALKDVKDKNALFYSRLGIRISRQAVQNLVYKYLEAAGLGHKRYSTHKLRHTAATLMYQSGGVDVRVLKEILGHEQLNTTQIYTHVSDTQIENAMEKNPLASKGALDNE